MASMPAKLQKLEMREKRFVREYLVDFCGAAAMRRAGFKGKRPEIAASKMMMRPSVKAALVERQDQIAARLEVTIERVLKEQAAIAFADPRRLFNEDGSLKAIHELDDATAASLSAIEVETLFETGEGGKRAVGQLHKLKRWDKGKALEHLSRFLGILKDDSAPPPVIGPGLVVMVQQNVAVQAGEAPIASGTRVEVRLPLPGPSGS